MPEHIDDTVHLMDESIRLLKDKNIRITPQRRIILKYMIEAKHHPTVEEIFDDVTEEYPGMSLATVYNNLRTLMDVGLVKEMKFSDVTSHFDFVYHDHHHIICEQCGKIADFNVDPHYLNAISQSAKEQTNYTVRKVSLELYGLCPECQQETTDEDK
ncbi:transcriptional repressor [Suicoccus acidiformans]|uniref:Transcriptional repressor n=1 Tax=Suicoccus acidiformans TaxID=2036206 RepID=A0A347WJ48_9LACT|nr:Fur family transcriptional regulator [Suicoccus acidiformans]AXY25105.1 transcriptional repressor [Suicoccus acidiformans]